MVIPDNLLTAYTVHLAGALLLEIMSHPGFFWTNRFQKIFRSYPPAPTAIRRSLRMKNILLVCSIAFWRVLRSPKGSGGQR